MRHKISPGRWFNRWQRIGRYSAEQMVKLHHEEQIAAKEEGPYNAAHLPQSWDVAGILMMERFDYGAGPFWPKGIKGGACQQATDAFLRHIYKHWAPIWERLSMSFEKDRGDVNYMSEMAAVHEVDDKIRNDPYEFPPQGGYSDLDRELKKYGGGT